MPLEYFEPEFDVSSFLMYKKDEEKNSIRNQKDEIGTSLLDMYSYYVVASPLFQCIYRPFSGIVEKLKDGLRQCFARD
jgi:hypothetical protein